MNKKLYALILAMSTGLAATNAVHAASITYLLDQSNVLPDGTNYLQVTIDDMGAPGDINFTITPLSPLTATAGSNFGIQKFGFNASGLNSSNIVNLPSGWSVHVPGGNFSSFGTFDFAVAGTGKHRADPLTFSITGVTGDSITSFANGDPFFVARVAGFDIPDANCGLSGDEGDDDNRSSLLLNHNNDKHNRRFDRHDNRRHSHGGKNKHGCGCVTTRSGFFAGSTPLVPPSAVPVPASVWLLGSGLIGLVGVARRKNA